MTVELRVRKKSLLVDVRSDGAERRDIWALSKNRAHFFHWLHPGSLANRFHKIDAKISNIISLFMCFYIFFWISAQSRLVRSSICVCSAVAAVVVGVSLFSAVYGHQSRHHLIMKITRNTHKQRTTSLLHPDSSGSSGGGAPSSVSPQSSTCRYTPGTGFGTLSDPPAAAAAALHQHTATRSRN